MENYLCVGMRGERVASGLKHRPQFDVIENFAVERDPK